MGRRHLLTDRKRAVLFGVPTTRDVDKFILDLTDGRNWPLAIRPMR
jgi:hypothetical protein